MVGANYMGGRRNFARARAKDGIGRTQKGFFGRQRLDILSKGLAANITQGGNDLASNKTLKSRAEISLAHARNLLSDDGLHDASFIPGPYNVSSSSPRARKYRKTSHQGPESSGTRTSKLLDILDTSEAIFIRGVLDKILAMPDLAGISKCRTRTVEEYTFSHQHNNRSQLTNSGHASIPTRIQRSSSPCDALLAEGRSFPSVKGILSDAHTSTLLPSSSPPTSYFCSDLPVCSFSSEHYEAMDVDMDVNTNAEKCFSDSEYLNFEAGLDSQARVMSALGTSSPPSPLWSKAPVTISGECPRISSPRLRSFLALASPPRAAAHNFVDPCCTRQCESLHGLQEYYQPELGPQQNVDRFASVFESEDPWNAIGAILGLPRVVNKQTSESDHRNPVDSLLFSRNSQHEASSYLCDDASMELFSDLGAEETEDSYYHIQNFTAATTDENQEEERSCDISEGFLERKKITKIPITSRFGGESVYGKPQVQQFQVQFSGLYDISSHSAAGLFAPRVDDDSSTADIDENMAAPSDHLTEEEAVASVKLTANTSRIHEETFAVDVPLPKKFTVLTQEQDEVDGLFEGPCLFLNDSDNSDEEI